MNNSPTDDLLAALASLGPRRHAMQVVAAEYRDSYVAEGDHAMAAVWQGIAVAVAEIEDDERDVLAALNFGLDVDGVMELPGEEVLTSLNHWRRWLRLIAGKLGSAGHAPDTPPIRGTR